MGHAVEYTCTKKAAILRIAPPPDHIYAHVEAWLMLWRRLDKEDHLLGGILEESGVVMQLVRGINRKKVSHLQRFYRSTAAERAWEAYEKRERARGDDPKLPVAHAEARPVGAWRRWAHVLRTAWREDEVEWVCESHYPQRSRWRAEGLRAMTWTDLHVLTRIGGMRVISLDWAPRTHSLILTVDASRPPRFLK